MSAIPPEAVEAALVARADALIDRPDPTALSEERLTGQMLEAAAPFLAADLTRRQIQERDAIRADIGQLLEALGLGDYARPESPHQVMLQCIAEVRRLRRQS